MLDFWAWFQGISYCLPGQIKHTYASTHISSPSLPVVGIQRYGSGFTEVGVDEDAPLGGVHRGHRDGFVSGVGPVQVVLEPVQSQTHRRLQGWVHQRHLHGGVTGLMDEGTAREGGRVIKGEREVGVFWGEQNMQVIIYSKPAVIAKSMCRGGMLTAWWGPILW